MKRKHIDKTSSSSRRKGSSSSTSSKRTFCPSSGIDTLDDLIKTCEKYISIIKKNNDDDVMNKLVRILPELQELNNMIGMNHVKTTIVQQLLYICQELNHTDDLNHICLYGTPGSGKTHVAELIGCIFAKIGLLSRGRVIKATRADLIGEHLGSTSIKTNDVLYSCKGNVLILDEIYSFGTSKEDRSKDSFAKECIDTLNLFLSEERDDFLCIICGYKNEIEDCFFSMNPGLRRRFPWTYDIGDYTPIELRSIFEKQVYDHEWSFIKENSSTDKLLSEIFHINNMHLFPFSGGDTEVLFSHCKIIHSKRLFHENCKQQRKMLNYNDLLLAFDKYKSFKEQQVLNKKNNTSLQMMYI